MKTMQREATILIPPHLVELLATGHDPAQVLELIEIHASMERRRAYGARRNRARRGGAVVVPFRPRKT
jgi:hypothetical protein